MINLQALLPDICEIAKLAGIEILRIYDTEYTIEKKSDNSPLTDADMAAHHTIVDALTKLTPDIPILSEESTKISFATRQSWETYWLIDPLDGTKEFINRNGEFTVNIALVHQHNIHLGVVYAPTKDLLYYAAKNLGAWRARGDETAVQIHSRTVSNTVLSIVGSRSHGSQRMQQFLDNLGDTELLSMGSSLKSCVVAEGSVDIYPRFGPTSEWDTGAAQCVVEEAGGEIVTMDMQPLRYNTKDSLLNPEFLVIGDISFNWEKALP